MIEFLDAINSTSAWLLAAPPALGYTIMGLLLTATIGTCGFALARLGRSPLWALVLLVPFASAIGIWILAYCRWRIHNSDHAGHKDPTTTA